MEHFIDFLCNILTRDPIFQSFGRSPSPEQLKASGSGGSCPICYDDYRSPTLLHCKHIFCEECLVSGEPVNLVSDLNNQVLT